MKVYISGPISNLDEEEYRTEFGLAEAAILNSDHEPVNPLKVVACETEDCNLDQEGFDVYVHSWNCYMRHNLIDMLGCEGILMLPNWPASKGAAIERHLAQRLGYTFFFIDQGKVIAT